MTEDYDDNRKLQPMHGKRTYIPGADEQFDNMHGESDALALEEYHRRSELGAEEALEEDDG